MKCPFCDHEMRYKHRQTDNTDCYICLVCGEMWEYGELLDYVNELIECHKEDEEQE